MSLELSKRVEEITPSATLAMVDKIQELRAKGIDIIALNIGEPDFDTPKHINDAIIKALNEGKTKYVSTAGIIELREAICAKLKADNNLTYTPNQIVVTTGAKQAIYESVMALVNEGDEVIIPTPCWVSYEEIVKVCGAKVIFVPTDLATFQLDIEAIEKAITSKTKAIIINSPNNPTGCVYTKEILENLALLATENKFYVIADEIYEKLNYSKEDHISIASLSDEIYNQTITINGFAKAYSMTGHRIGYLAAPINIAKKIANLQTHMTSNSTTPVQYGGVEALQSNQELVTEMVQEFKERRELAFKLLDEIKDLKYSKVEGAFYIMIDISSFFNKEYEGVKIKNSDDMSMYLLENANVALVSGTSFQAPNYLRLSYSNSKENIELGIKKIQEALIQLK